MRILMGLLIALAWFAPAQAADGIAIAPVPDWVQPVKWRVSAAPSTGSISYLLADLQLHFEPGRTSSYTETAFRIESPEGLAAGNISLPWRPGIDTVTVHRLLIHRSEQIIDILGSGQTFTIVRREANLEDAMLDGELTATIQPEGLQVGDIIDMAVTIQSSDPTYGRHVEHLSDSDYSVTIDRVHFSAQWPSTLPLRIRQTSGLPPLTAKRDGDRFKVDMTLDQLEPVTLPKGAPSRFRMPRVVELSDFRSWSELAALLRPLYDKATALPPGGALQGEIARIRASSPDPVTRAEAAMALVQGQVRYVALLMGSGNLTPADATLTWNRRFGDCKAKSALLVAMLRALGIDAVPVIVNNSDGDGMDERLPMTALFDHVIVRATIAGKVYWIDGTRTGDRRLGQLAIPDVGWGLPLVSNAALVRMLPAQIDRPHLDTSLRIDLRNGISLPAPAHVEISIVGDEAYKMTVSSANLTPDARDRHLRNYWKKHYPFIEIRSTSASYDADKREHRLVMDGNATLNWEDGYYWLTKSGLGSINADFERDPKEDQQAPFVVSYPYYARSTETFLLPRGIVPLNADVDEIAGGVEYRRKGRLVDDRFTVETSTRSLAPEFPARDAPAAQRTIRSIAESYVALHKSPDYTSTDAEVDSRLAVKPETFEQYIERGFLLLDRGDWSEALAALNKAVRLQPDHELALAARGTAHAQLRNFAAANRDFDKVAAIDPNNIAMLRGRGLIAHALGRTAEAIRYYSRALDQDPEDLTALGWRAKAYFKLDDSDAALRDTATAIKLSPDWGEMYNLRAAVFITLGKNDEALAQARAIIAANPEDSEAYIVAGRIYQRLGRVSQAGQALDRSLELKPDALIHYHRSLLRPWADIARRLDDIAAALRLDPKLEAAQEQKALLLRRQGDRSAATAALDDAIRLLPDNAGLLALRASFARVDGDAQRAARDFATARAAAKTSDDFNNICWAKARMGIELASALEDCTTAIAKDSDNYGPIDSRAFVLLKLGRNDDAIADYDRALALESELPESLLGRAIAWARKGDKARSDADRAAAVALDPDIIEEFRSYGMTL